MPTEDGLPAVGDVIMSQKFMFARQSEIGSFLRILNVPEVTSAPLTLTLEEPNGTVHTRSTVTANIGGDAYDRSRANAEFVVEEARWFDNMITVAIENCSTRWFVTARRLKNNRKYDPAGERIVFFMCGLVDELVLAPKDIHYVRKMRVSQLKTAKA